MGNPEDAAPRYEEALYLAREQSEAVHEAAALASLSIAYRESGRLRESLRCGRGALELLRNLGDLQAEAYVLSSLAESYHGFGILSRRPLVPETVAQAAPEGERRQGRGGVLRNLARVYDNLGDTGRVRDALEEAARKEIALEVASVGAERGD